MAGDEFLTFMPQQPDKSEKSALCSQTHDYNLCLFLLVYKIAVTSFTAFQIRERKIGFAQSRQTSSVLGVSFLLQASNVCLRKMNVVL